MHVFLHVYVHLCILEWIEVVNFEGTCTTERCQVTIVITIVNFVIVNISEFVRHFISVEVIYNRYV